MMHSVSKSTWDRQLSPPISPTSRSLSSLSEFEAIAEQLCIADVTELKSEILPVGYKKLNKMIKTPTHIDGVCFAEAYFEKIHEITNTCIGWPCDINYSYNESYVRVIGRPDDNTWAKGLIQGRLPPKSPLLKIKMAILSSDIPGIKTSYIMEQTGTHIQIAEENSEVEMYGSSEGLGKAVEFLFLSSPFTMSFELPSKLDIAQMDTLQDEVIVDVNILPGPTPNTYVFHIKGTAKEADILNDAVHSIADYVCETKPTKILVTMHLRMCPQLQDIIYKKNCSIIRHTKEITKTEIEIIYSKEFDKSQPNILSITGTIDEVYEAKHKLQRCLPIEFIFDIPDNPKLISEISDFRKPYGTSVSIQQHKEDNVAVVTVKGFRWSIFQLYAAHQKIIDMSNDSDIKIPAYRQTMENTINRYHIPNEGDPFSIWVPTDPSIVNNFLQVKKQDDQAEVCNTPSCSDECCNTPPCSDECCNIPPCSGECCNNTSPCSYECCNTPPCSDECCKASCEELPSCSTDSTKSGDGRCSSDWVLMSEAVRHPTDLEGYSAEDLEVSLILSNPLPRVITECRVCKTLMN